MKRFIASFVGRQVGAIGISSRFQTIVDAENEEAARIALYDRYEHIHGLQLSEIPYPETTP